MNAYILRSKPHWENRENQFLDGRLSIGWPCGESLEGKNREDISTALAGKYPDISEISVSMIDLFVSMPVGSIVLTPSLQNKSLIHVFRITSGYKYDSTADTNDIGNPHFIEADFLRTVPRNNLPNAVLRSLSGARKTLSRISQHFDLLDDFISLGFEVNAESSLASTGSRVDAMNVLYELLNSDSEDIRLQAAVAIVQFD